MAQAFTAFDRFFCSLLSSTYPNREYMHAGQSYGKIDNSLPSGSGFPDTTIFAALSKAGVSNQYFYTDIPVSALWGKPGLQRSSQVQNFYEQAAAGTLPALSFVDPSFNGEDQGTSGDEHPARRRPRRPGVRRRRRARVHGVAAVQARRAVHRLRRVGRLLRPRRPAARARPAHQPRPQPGLRPDGLPDPGRDRLALSRGAATSTTPIYGFESILKMIRYRYGLPPLTPRDLYANNIAAAFDFAHPNFTPPALPTPPQVISSACAGTVPADSGGAGVDAGRCSAHRCR